MAELHDLKRPPRQARKRLGRGPGSGTGKTSGRGHKGAKARAGSGGPGGGKPYFEGGQQPLQRRVPKRGFTPRNRLEYQVVNLHRIAPLEEAEITPEVLRARGLVRSAKKPVKVLGGGELERKVTISAHAFSRQARETIERAGGSVQVIS
ncbi:MAG: 50S ribosomal protein L15 [Longimicrobiaceae bacterium]